MLVITYTVLNRHKTLRFQPLWSRQQPSLIWRTAYTCTSIHSVTSQSAEVCLYK